MSEAFAWAITALVLALLAGFAIWCAGLLALRADQRVRTPTYNRFGERIGTIENPDFHIGPGEESESAPQGAEAELQRTVQRDGRGE
ncbi:MAG TPA: hypothetical protein VH916_10895 [Dehalococcoidia bacterium]|jgi:hypothetical protein